MFNGRHHWRCPGVRTHTLAQEVVHGAGALELTRRGCAGYWEAVDFYRVINDSQASPLETFVPAAQLVEAAAAAPSSRPGTLSSRHERALRDERASRMA